MLFGARVNGPSLALGFAIVAGSPAALASHLPLDLWELARRSNLIVVAVVLSDKAEEGRASLLIVEELRAPAEGIGSEVEVSYDPLYPCGRPTFEAGQRVVAFLNLKGGRVQATGFEQSTRYPANDEQLEHLRRLVLDALDLQLAASTPYESLLSWFDAAWKTPGTRWDGRMFAMKLLLDPAARSVHGALRADLRSRCRSRDAEACALLGFDRAHHGSRKVAARFWRRACALGDGISCLAYDYVVAARSRLNRLN